MNRLIVVSNRLPFALDSAGEDLWTVTPAVGGLVSAVEPVLRERHPELAFVAGDLDQPRFGRPPGERWEAVLLANILHDHPAERCPAIVATAASHCARRSL